MWCRYNQVIRVTSKKLPTLSRCSVCTKMFKSIARYVNAAVKKTRDKVGNRLYSPEGLKLCYVTGMIQ